MSILVSRHQFKLKVLCFFASVFLMLARLKLKKEEGEIEEPIFQIV